MSKIVCIGAGMGGLTAGCLLAGKGHRVILCESHTLPGGYTAGFHRKGFYFESGTLSFESSSQVFSIMKELGVFERISFIPQHSRMTSKRFDISAETFPDFQKAIIAAYPDEQLSLERYFAAVEPIYRYMKKIMIDSGGWSKLSGGLGLFRQYLKYRNLTLSEFTARYFDSDTELYRLFKSFGYPDMSAWILGGAYATVFNDYWTVKEGMQSWADILAERFTGMGGELRLKTRVNKIVTRDGTAVGVETEDGRIDADWVISACDYKKTLLELIDDPGLVEEGFRNKIRDNAVSEGIFTVYLGLSIPTDELRRIMKIPHVILIDEQPGADVRDSGDSDFFEKCSVTLYSPSLFSDGLAPEGKSSLMLQAVSPYRWLDNWGGGDREQYCELKERVKQILIKKAERIIPGLQQRIEFSDAATPLTYERYTGNSDGATSAWSWNPNNRFHKSMMKSYVDTPVNRLLIGSCWASQIGGVPGALSAAQKCVKRIGKGN